MRRGVAAVSTVEVVGLTAVRAVAVIGARGMWGAGTVAGCDEGCVPDSAVAVVAAG